MGGKQLFESNPLIELVDKFEEKNRQQFVLAYNMLMNPDSLVDIILQRELKNSVKDREILIDLLNQNLALQCQKILDYHVEQCIEQMEITCLTTLPRTLTYGELNAYSTINLPKDDLVCESLSLSVSQMAQALPLFRFSFRWREKLAEEVLLQFNDQKVQWYYLEKTQSNWVTIRQYMEDTTKINQFF